ncbi:uracil DNA glycosylase, partial [Coemansia furcata]
MTAEASAAEATGSKRKTLDSYFGSKKAKASSVTPASTTVTPSPLADTPSPLATASKGKQADTEATDKEETKDKDEAKVPEVSSEDRPELALEYSTIDASWLKRIGGELTKPYFLSLKKFLRAEAAAKKTVYPSDGDIYSWSRFAPFDKVRVVILGQDPYHGPGQAHGLAFSVQPGVRTPPSLANMYKALARDFPGFVAPKHGYLAGWAEQGVLLLNAALT